MRGRSAFPVWDCTQRAEYQPWHPLSKEERAEKLQWVREPRTASPCPSRAAHCGAVIGNTLSNASGFRKGWAGPGPSQQRAGTLGPGEAAHLAVARAWLVHERAVLTGPHGRSGRVCGAPDGAVLVETWELHANCAAQLLDGGPLLRPLPCLGELLISGPHSLQQQADAVLQRHNFIGDQEQQEVEI